ncbi:MAG: lanthionine synthetase LanC family protein [Gemmatimonadota bacterium]
MPITDPLVLPIDVTITPVEALSPGVRRRIAARDGEFAVTRPRGRTPIKIISADSARLLETFRHPQPVATAILDHSRQDGRSADLVLADAFPLLRDCFNARFLVPAGSPESAAILPTRERGDRVGRFEVVRCLQLLDDSELYQARDPRGRVVALKLARPGATRGMRGQLDREAQVLRHLGGKGVPRLIARGTHRRRPWIAISWCEGVSPEIVFSELRTRRNVRDQKRIARLGARIVRSYARLHAAGILHGDVHPENILVGRRDDITLVDFGLARAIPPLRLKGNPGTGGVGYYYSPEVAGEIVAGRPMPPPTAAGEQYSVGALLFLLFTGRHYADLGLDQGQAMRQIVSEPARPFSLLGVTPWPALESVLGRALEKAPEKRYPTMSAMARAFAGVATPPPVAPLRAAGPTPLDSVVDEFLGEVGYDSAAFAEPGIAPTGSIMLGRGGIAWALYRLACLRDDGELLALADAWLSRIERDLELEDTFAAPGTELTVEAMSPVSPFHSASGVHLLRALIALAMGDDDSVDAAVAGFCAVASRPWDNPDFTLGRGSVVLGCGMLLETLPAGREQLTEPIRDLGNAVLEQLWQQADRQGPIGPSLDFGGLGMAHGWGGLLYTTLRWSAAAGAGLPRQFLRRLNQLGGCAESVGRGLHWWQPEGPLAASPLASHQVAGWCNGPSGFISLWTLAQQRLHRPDFLRLAEGAGWSSWEAASPLPDLCCGLAGRAYGLLNLYRHTGDQEWLERARVLAERAARSFASRRSTLERPLGLYKGMAGIAVLAADLVHPERSALPFFEAEGWPESAGRND